MATWSYDSRGKVPPLSPPTCRYKYRITWDTERKRERERERERKSERERKMQCAQKWASDLMGPVKTEAFRCLFNNG
ncbi:hypothetical protein JZ751_017948 [Albula glossodonta]|uniref:Uncharacterized protein n=1 Tax=Albula glossodonta TaxID=121402 RepID=A0A8T2PPT5_9TELE|nr:hypothetical protein JZ751_017948 [Albula glossodonta]